MPRHRLLADDAAAWGAGATASGEPEWQVRTGEVVPVVLDATGWLGSATIDNVTWESSTGLVLSGKVATAREARCRAYIPPRTEGVRHAVRATLVASDGRVRAVRVHLRAQ
jgi:hypothetical protein